MIDYCLVCNQKTTIHVEHELQNHYSYRNSTTYEISVTKDIFVYFLTLKFYKKPKYNIFNIRTDSWETIILTEDQYKWSIQQWTDFLQNLLII